MHSFKRNNLQNIRGLFSEKTGVNLDKNDICHDNDYKFKRPYSRKSIRSSATVVFAAILALSMAVVAVAVVTSDWLPIFFASRSGNTLTPKQYEFLEEKSVNIGQSVTEDGYTVTVDSAICDAQNLFLIIRVKGPEGVKLAPAPDDGSCFFDYAKCESTGTYPKTGYLIGSSASWRRLDDGDGKENTVTFIHQKQRVMSSGSNQVYTDGEIWRLHLADLTVRAGAPTYEKTILAEGGWSFAFPLTEVNGEMELISSPVVCVAQAGGEASSKESIEMMVTSFVLRPFGATCSYSFIPGVRPESVDILDVHLVMKDGSTVIAKPRSGGGAGGVGSTGGTMTYTFDAPIMLDEVDYLVLPENVQVPSINK